jgi:hypothetical protein
MGRPKRNWRMSEQRIRQKVRKKDRSQRFYQSGERADNGRPRTNKDRRRDHLYRGQFRSDRRTLQCTERRQSRPRVEAASDVI